MSQGESAIITYLVCANPMLKAGLGHILANTRYDVHDQDKAASGGRPGSHPADPALFIVDANVKDAFGAESIASLKAGNDAVRVVILADTFNLDEMTAALKNGADGYCLPTVDALLRYLDLVMLGETVFPSGQFLSAILDGNPHHSTGSSHHGEVPATRPGAQASDTRMLSNRESEILQCLMQGAPNKIIARQLDVAEATVKVHVKAILRKIQVANRTQAAMWAVEHLPPSAPDTMMAEFR